jgi:hypothetical protein
MHLWQQPANRSLDLDGLKEISPPWFNCDDFFSNAAFESAANAVTSDRDVDLAPNSGFGNEVLSGRSGVRARV